MFESEAKIIIEYVCCKLKKCTQPKNFSERKMFFKYCNQWIFIFREIYNFILKFILIFSLIIISKWLCTDTCIYFLLHFIYFFYKINKWVKYFRCWFENWHFFCEWNGREITTRKLSSLSSVSVQKEQSMTSKLLFKQSLSQSFSFQLLYLNRSKQSILMLFCFLCTYSR